MAELLFFAEAFLLSYVLTGAILRFSLRRRLLDVPNDRSSHSIPKPRLGGAAITVAFLGPEGTFTATLNVKRDFTPSSGTLPNPGNYGIYLVDAFGNKELIYRDPAIACQSPIPLRPRPKPPVLADVTDPTVDDAVCAVSDIAYGCDGIDPARVRYLRIAEPIGCSTYISCS